MSGPAFRLALRHGIRTAIIVGFGLGLFHWVIIASSSGFAGDPQNVPKFLAQPPRAINALLGGAADFLRPSGWLASGMYHPVVMALQTTGAFIVAASSGIAELERGTLDLVLSRPVSRMSYLRARIAAGLVLLSIVEVGGLIGALVSRATIADVDQVPVADIVRLFAASLLLFALFMLLTFAVFVRAGLRSRALGTSIGLVIGAFFINFVSLLFEQTEWLRFVTPFHYFRAGEIISRGDYIGDLAILAVAAAAAYAFALRDFDRRDLTR